MASVILDKVKKVYAGGVEAAQRQLPRTRRRHDDTIGDAVCDDAHRRLLAVDRRYAATHPLRDPVVVAGIEQVAVALEHLAGGGQVGKVVLHHR